MFGDWLYETGPEVHDYLYGGHRPTVRYLADHCIAPSGAYSHVHAVLVTRAGEILGLEQGFAGSVKEK